MTIFFNKLHSLRINDTPFVHQVSTRVLIEYLVDYLNGEKVLPCKK